MIATTKTELISGQKTPLCSPCQAGEQCHCLTINICNQHQSRFLYVNLSCDTDKYERKYPLVAIAVNQPATRNGCKDHRSLESAKEIHHARNEQEVVVEDY